MPSLPWCKWYPSKWLSSETRLAMTLEERSIYRDLLDCNYEKGSLPNDPRMLAHLAGASQEEFDRAWLKVGENFNQRKEDPSRLSNPVVDKELLGREKMSRLGRLSGKSRSATNGMANGPLGTPLAKRATDQPTEARNPVQPDETRREEKRHTQAVTPPLKDAFDKVAARYPNCTGVDLAFQNWMVFCDQGVITEASAHEVLEGLERYIKSELWSRDNGRYITSFAKWLHEKKWMDRPAASVESRAAERSDKKSSAGNDPLVEWVPPWKDDK